MTSVERDQVSRDAEVVAHLLARVSVDLGMLLDRPLAIQSCAVARSPHKVAGERSIHVAFKLGFTVDGRAEHGALLVPLAEAISFAGYLMMLSDEVVAARRQEQALDRTTKDAMVEVGNLISDSIDGGLRDIFVRRATARSEGCQGVKPGAAPAFEHAPGSELVVARARLRLHTYPIFEALLMLPVVPPAS